MADEPRRERREKATDVAPGQQAPHTRTAGLVLTSFCAALVFALAGACAVAQQNQTSLCTYGDQALGIFDELQGRELSGITEYSSPAEVGAYGSSGEELTGEMLEKWHRLDPPVEARLWHDSMEEWITTLSGNFAILSIAENRPPDEVARVTRSSLELIEGLLYEANQLVTQADQLFADCEGIS